MRIAPEYLLRVWGRDEEQVAALRAPDLRERPDGPLCYWFATEAEREAFIATWPASCHVMRDVVNPGDDGEELIDTRAFTKAHVVLRSEDGRLVIVVTPFGYGYPAHSAEFMWTEGNNACDCNRRLYIWRQDGVSTDDIDARENPCGDTIELVAIAVSKEPLGEP